MTSVVRFVDVSKRFILSPVHNRSFQDSLVDFLHQRRRPRQEFWALRGVSFSVQSGDLLGIIGRNGSGKSTILKLIARILEPTTGEVIATGRVSSMLELGTGFHPDLTGRENISLYGSLLGCNGRSMHQRYPEIISFAELEQFIDMPLRLYSSGMQMRLGFAVASAIEPDVLLVDEVLAVGDDPFHAKCLNRIATMSDSGKTIILVSHDLGTIQKICNRVMWIDHGQIQADGDPKETVDKYLAHLYGERIQDVRTAAQTHCKEDRSLFPQAVRCIPESYYEAPPATRDAGISAIRLRNKSGQESNQYEPGAPVRVEIHYWTSHKVDQPVFGVEILHADGQCCFRTNTEADAVPIDGICGEGVISVLLLSLNLSAGEYRLNASLRSRSGSFGNDTFSACTFSVRVRCNDAASCPIPHQWEVHMNSVHSSRVPDGG